MIKRIKNLQPVSDLPLRVSFDDGRVVLYDVAKDVRQIPDFKPLDTEPALFNQVQLDQSRTCVYWNNRIDMPSDIIYEYGRELLPAIAE